MIFILDDSCWIGNFYMQTTMITDPNFVKVIKSKLTELGIINVDEFISLLINVKAVIAGSFPLQCLLGEQYEDSDIDIFCEGICSDDCNAVRSGYDDTLYPELCTFDRWIYNTFKIRGIPSDYFMNGVIRIKMFSISEKLRLNVIQVSTLPFDFVVNTFDFSFCQTIFDGQLLHFHPITLTKMGWRIRSSLAKIKPKKPFHKYTIDGTNDPQNEKLMLYPKNPEEFVEAQNAKRLKKYKDRGFVIYELHDIQFIKNMFGKQNLPELCFPETRINVPLDLSCEDDEN